MSKIDRPGLRLVDETDERLAEVLPGHLFGLLMLITAVTLAPRPYAGAHTHADAE